jgi:REP element-mobilizing transposase RayT
MADSLSQIYIHLVLAVQFRKGLIDPIWEEDFHKYTTGCIKGMDQLVIEINSMPDHLHTLFRMKPTCRLSDFIRELKKGTTAYVQKKKLCSSQFGYQGGYGAFSCHQKDVDLVRNYIRNQKLHHQKEQFSQEYPRLLKEADIPFEEQYMFEFIDCSAT